MNQEAPEPQATLHHGAGREPSRAIVPTLVLTATVSSAIGSLGAPLLETIARDDHVTLGTAQWSLTLPMLVGAVVAPVLGRLGDGPSRRNVVLWTLTVVLIGSVVVAIPGWGFAALLVGRSMQGLGFALMPLTMAVARDSLPEARSGPAIAVLSIAATAGIGLGFPLTGLLDETLGLHACFWVGAIMAGGALLLNLVVLPASRHLHRRRLDVAGGVLIGCGLLALLVAVTEGSTWGWFSPRVLLLLAGAAILIVIWVFRELSVAHPLVDLRLVRHRSVAITNVTASLIAMAMYMFLPLLTNFVQTPPSEGYGFGASVLVTGLMLVPFAVLSTSMSRVARMIGHRVPPERLVPIGAMLMALATIMFLVTSGALWEGFVATGLVGVGVGLSFAAMPGLIIRSVPASETGSALGFYQVVRTVGFALGSGVSASILAAYTLSGQLLPERAGFEVAFATSAVICLVAAAVSTRLRRPQTISAVDSPPMPASVPAAAAPRA
jgi:MFS family permease